MSKNKKKIKRLKKYSNFFVVIIVPIIISVIGIWYVKQENDRNEQILEPKFSLEKNVDKDESLIWKLCNSGGTINNAIIYPTIHVTFWIYNEEADIDTEITIEILGYYTENNNYYSNSLESEKFSENIKKITSSATSMVSLIKPIILKKGYLPQRSHLVKIIAYFPVARQRLCGITLKKYCPVSERLFPEKKPMDGL